MQIQIGVFCVGLGSIQPWRRVLRRKLFGDKIGFFFSTSMRDFNFGVMLHAMSGVQGTLKESLGFSTSLMVGLV